MSEPSKFQRASDKEDSELLSTCVHLCVVLCPPKIAIAWLAGYWVIGWVNAGRSAIHSSSYRAMALSRLPTWLTYVPMVALACSQAKHRRLWISHFSICFPLQSHICSTFLRPPDPQSPPLTAQVAPMDIAAAMQSRAFSPRNAPASDFKMPPLSPPPFVPALRFQISPLKATVPLPPLAVAIRAASVTPPFALDKKCKDTTSTPSRVARRILQDERNAKSRLVFDFSVEEMAQFYHLPQRVAAKCLGVAVITVKRNCKRRGIKWPYRAEKLKHIQQTKQSLKLSRHARNARASVDGGRVSVGAKMTPMLLLSEAARAYSRLPVECMGESATKPATSAIPHYC